MSAARLSRGEVEALRGSLAAAERHAVYLAERIDACQREAARGVAAREAAALRALLADHGAAIDDADFARGELRQAERASARCRGARYGRRTALG